MLEPPPVEQHPNSDERSHRRRSQRRGSQLVEQHQPLDLPAQLDALEDELRLERITEPERLLAPLREIAGDDTLPFIARNHATRLIAGIEKKKFKSPMKKQ